MFAIETESLSKRFGGFSAVRDLTLQVSAGEAFGFLGLNGAGKSTTVKMLATLLAPTSGAARVLGYDVRQESQAIRDRIGYMAEETGSRRPSWTAREYITFFADIRGLGEDHACALLETVGLTEAMDAPMDTYSGGMVRRAELARALVGHPRLLFLDEATKDLDIPSKRRMWDLLGRLRADGVTLFVSSHDILEIREVCTRIGVVASGRLRFVGPLRDLATDSTGDDDLREIERRLVLLLEGAA